MQATRPETAAAAVLRISCDRWVGRVDRSRQQQQKKKAKAR